MTPTAALNTSTAATILVAVSLLAATSGATEPVSEPQALVRDVLARADAMTSGSFHYRVRCGMRGAPDAKWRGKAFTEMGDDWRLDEHGAEFTRSQINHHGRFLEMRGTMQPSGRILTGVDVEVPRRVREKTALPFPPTFLGTFWDPSTAQYVRDHGSEARLGNAEVVDGIDCVVLEWSIRGSDLFNAFKSICPALSKESGTLRVFVAPQLGYCLPRVDQIQGETVCIRYVARQFERVPCGLHVPRAVSRLQFDDKGNESFCIDYEITAIRNVNQAIGDGAFIVSIPEGAAVYVRTGAQPVNFLLGRHLENSEEIEQAAPKPQTGRGGAPR
ncbi:MAG TPA: hypothetical protein VMF30_18610 [Pirellulales bacterium]|nr:hypothetical protein [Pirellulales bacterium]